MKYRDEQHASEHRRISTLYLQGAIDNDERRRQQRAADTAAYRRQMQRQWMPEWLGEFRT